jgi:hypothetical protein
MKLRGLIILDFVFIFITVAFYCVIYILANSQNSTIYNFKGWILSDYRRLGQCQYLLFDTTLLIGISHKIFTLPYITSDFLIEHIHLFSEKIEASNLVLLDSGDTSSILGIDQELDKYNMYNICDTFKPVDNIVDSYSCSGLISIYNLIVSLAQSIVRSYPNQSFPVNSNWFHIHQIINKYIRIPQSYSINILTNLFNKSNKNYDNSIIIILDVGIFIYLCLFLLLYYFISKIDYYF